MEIKQAEKITEEFFKKRFPDKDIKFEKECGYFWEWVDRFKSGHPEYHMDSISKRVWRKMKELTPKQEDFLLEQAREKNYEEKEAKADLIKDYPEDLGYKMEE